MNQKLAELFLRKLYWENKRDNLYTKMLWNYANNGIFLLMLAIYPLILFAKIKNGQIGYFDWTEIFWYDWLRIISFFIMMLLFVFNLVGNIYDCYCRLPRYHKKIKEIDHQIIAELERDNQEIS